MLTAAATAVMVVARVSADADQPTLAESLRAIADNSATYATSGAARCLSGVTLLIAGWYLWRTAVIRERLARPLVPALFVASGVATVVSGVSAIALVASASDVSQTAGSSVVAIDATTETIAYLRWLTGTIGFTLAGLGLIIAARYQWSVGGALRRIAPASGLTGIAMLFIWFDAATVMHRVSGIAFFAWLVVIGVMLWTGRAEQRYSAPVQDGG